MKEFESLVHVRNEEVSGVGPWYWIIKDSGAWDGPKADWEKSHKETIEKHVENWNACVQAGGNQGMYPRLLSGMFKRVYTFEPDELNFYCLSLNCQINTVYKMQAALGSVGGLVGLNRNSDTNTGCHTINPEGTIPQITVDSLGLDACDFIMLDVEGYEILSLQGAFNTIDRFRPVISCERGGDEIKNFLSPFGYTVVGSSVSDVYYKVER